MIDIQKTIIAFRKFIDKYDYKNINSKQKMEEIRIIINNYIDSRLKIVGQKK